MKKLTAEGSFLEIENKILKIQYMRNTYLEDENSMKYSEKELQSDIEEYISRNVLQKREYLKLRLCLFSLDVYFLIRKTYKYLMQVYFALKKGEIALQTFCLNKKKKDVYKRQV